MFWVSTGPTKARFEFLVSVCQQCQRPACLRNCGAGAIVKHAESGVVEIDAQRCTGCQEYVRACPYGAISFDHRLHRAQKCDLCADRRASGRGGPACAAACPGRALHFGSRADLLARARDEGRRVRDIDHFGLHPGTVYLDTIEPAASPDAGGESA